ncbi:ImmA/IrrE family metallo-endopeptidase [Leifsonia sp. NPDC014704]|uniref:ImmA/IrrE family metallo-endopeptidase n=1 Tax=Leifsonia sp. NPDC014704 TaxID=3364123 RepID=UPI0036F493E1
MTERADRIRARLDAKDQAALILEEFNRQAPDQLDALRADPIAWLEAWPQVELVQLEPNRVPGSSDECVVDGTYVGASTPPRIGVGGGTQTRTQFTALHELGHHLQMTGDALLDALGERSDLGRSLEEAASDAFAAAVLIPEDIAKQYLGVGTPAAAAIAELWKQLPHASRQAVLVRAAQALTSDGHVLLLNAEGGVEFAACRGAIRLPRLSDQSKTALWRAGRSNTSGTWTSRTRFRYGQLEAGDTFYAQAASIGAGYQVVVAAVEKVPWMFSVNQPEYHRYGREAYCERCTEEFFATSFCGDCSQPVCPRCNRCGCGGGLAEFTCKRCGFIRSPGEASAVEGVCTECTAV